MSADNLRTRGTQGVQGGVHPAKQSDTHLYLFPPQGLFTGDPMNCGIPSLPLTTTDRLLG